ncbi:MAG: putative dynein heavy chain [Streblomastix strix]|uniref:Putative dynein heavy chain n=1 Tax=Streblomastix strix TaxID=222440 RepID=A0A5J4TF66_9EUKA|nr:MAG: putative dynein heavy chain [Streblomastix strix]
MPAPDTFGSQPPLELIRQMLGTGGWYDRQLLQFRPIKGTSTIAACGPPGGGRNKVSERLTALFTQLRIPQPSEKSLFSIFNSILYGHVKQYDYQQVIKDVVAPVVRASIELYNHALAELRPTPSKSHYVFNVRDLSKVFQGMMNTNQNTVQDELQFQRLWAHESCRIFADRLISKEDRNILTIKICDLAKQYFHQGWNHDEIYVIGQPKMWLDFLQMGSDLPRPYEELQDIKKIQPILANALADFNADCALHKQKEVDIVFFTDAVEHIARITRIIRQARGNALLVGVGGCGKQSLTRLSSFIAGCQCFEIQLSKNYGQNEFREDLRKLYGQAGADGKPTVFLLNDTQIVKESFLEDLNCILGSGEEK